jgi:hypothetical protein
MYLLSTFIFGNQLLGLKMVGKNERGENEAS